MRAALQAIGHAADEFEVVITQLVNLLQDGGPVRLSKRAGDIIELRDVLDEVGPDAARLTYLLQSVDSPQTFDFDVVKSQAMENPVFYVQMAHARIRSIRRVAEERGVLRAPLEDVELTHLTHERELEVLRALSELPDVVLLACRERAPHKVTTWVRELAGAFHGFYHDCYVLGDGVAPELTQARLWLVESAEIGLKIGLDLLGVAAPESM
jgi:arginyl-tRNA synthetase